MSSSFTSITMPAMTGVKSPKAMATIEDIQREFYPEPGPASTAVRASGFAFEDLLIEIEAMAVRRD